MDIILQSVVAIEGGVRILDHLLQILLVDAGHLVGVGIILSVCLVEIHLCQEGGGRGFCRTSLVGLHLRQGIIRLHQVVDDQLPSLIIGIGGVRELVILIVGQGLVHHEGDMLIQSLEQEMSVGTEELHLSQTRWQSSHERYYCTDVPTYH